MEAQVPIACFHCKQVKVSREVFKVRLIWHFDFTSPFHINNVADKSRLGES